MNIAGNKRDMRLKWRCSDSKYSEKKTDDTQYMGWKCKYCYLCSTFLLCQPSLSKTSTTYNNRWKTRLKPIFVQYLPRKLPKQFKAIDKPLLDTETIYKVKITTGNRVDAGTDAKASISLRGRTGTMKQTPLIKRSTSAAFVFIRGTTETFYLKSPELGELQHLTIEHDGITKSQGWFVECLEITNMQTNQKWLARPHRWISLHHADNKRRLRIAVETYQPEVIQYRITVITGKKLFAGTDAQVFITIYGEKVQTRKVRLVDPSKKCFEQGRTDTFQVELPDVGSLKSLRVEHDGTGTAPGWFLDKIEITKTNKTYVFSCKDWISATKGSGKLWRHLYARSQILTKNPDVRTKYEVTVETGDIKMAGTDANVYINVIGDLGDTGKLSLKSPGKDNFERAKTDVFTVVAEDVGDIHWLVIGHDNSGIGPGWFLNKVSVRQYVTRRMKDRRAKQNKKEPLPIDEDSLNPQAFITLLPFQELERELLLEFDEGCRITGDYGVTKPQHIGTVQKWQNISVAPSAAQRTHDTAVPILREYVFTCNRWLAKDEDDGEIERQLKSEQKTVYTK